jgi:3-oxoacyl-[acyl-carrier-protein] synthase I
VNSPVDGGRGVPIVGIGAQTAVGRRARPAAAAVRAQAAGVGVHPNLVDRMGHRVTVAMAPWIAPDVGLFERLLLLAGPAIDETLAPLVDRLRLLKVPLTLLLGLPAERPGFTASMGSEVFSRLAARVDADIPLDGGKPLLLGHVAGLVAVEEGCRLIREGRCEACLAGGVESYIDRVTIEWIDWTGQLHAPSNPWGFTPGEAAGFCLLVSPQLAARLELEALVTVVAVATVQEQQLRRDHAVCLGEGLTDSFRRSLAGLPSAETKVTRLICDHNGQPHRGEEYAFAALRVHGRLQDPSDLFTPARSWGDVGAASGPLFAMLAASQRNSRRTGGPYSLIWTSAMVAERTSALLCAGAPASRT